MHRHHEPARNRHQRRSRQPISIPIPPRNVEPTRDRQHDRHGFGRGKRARRWARHRPRRHRDERSGGGGGYGRRNRHRLCGVHGSGWRGWRRLGRQRRGVRWHDGCRFEPFVSWPVQIGPVRRLVECGRARGSKRSCVCRVVGVGRRDGGRGRTRRWRHRQGRSRVTAYGRRVRGGGRVCPGWSRRRRGLLMLHCGRVDH